MTTSQLKTITYNPVIYKERQIIKSKTYISVYNESLLNGINRNRDFVFGFIKQEEIKKLVIIASTSRKH